MTLSVALALSLIGNSHAATASTKTSAVIAEPANAPAYYIFPLPDSPIKPTISPASTLTFASVTGNVVLPLTDAERARPSIVSIGGS